MKLNDKDFKLQTGTTKENFNHMLEILKYEYEKAHVNGSNKGIGYECRLVLALSYWREYRGMRQMAFDYDIALSTVCSSIHWVEDVLSKHQDFIFGTIEEEIKKLEKEGTEVMSIIGDVTEQAIERPTLNQEESYSGKKKRHTTKNQIIIDEKSKKILNYFNQKGTIHDFQIIKNSNIINNLNDLSIEGKFDSGYQEIQKLMDKVSIPYKNTKLHKLTDEEKKYNKNLSSVRIKIEHTNRCIKIFRIIKEVYRNHMNRYDKRLQIICAIYNMNLN